MRAACCAWVVAASSFAAMPARSACEGSASPSCYVGFDVAGAGKLHYIASRSPGETPASPVPTTALIAMHGHPRDAGRTFDAALTAVRGADALASTLVVAPLFQVAAGDAQRCSTPGEPAADDGDLMWTCASWIDGSPARNGGGITSFAALDALVSELARQWPSLHTVTIAGFSAGAQMVQHYIGFAGTNLGSAAPASPGGVALRYVVASPGSWLYFDPIEGAEARCPGANRWKYGTEALPETLGRSAADARARYAQADIRYLAGERDSSAAPGTFYKILDKSCAAMAQGPYRLQRAQAYAAYDRAVLAPGTQRQLVVVPGCAHDVACVFASPAARAALLGPGR